MKNVIISPIITEKAMKASEGGKYSFLVDRSASKTSIKLAVASLFNVKVVNVQTSILKGRTKRFGARRLEIAQPVVKKAIVELKKGEKISMFEPGGGEEEKKDKKKK